MSTINWISCSFVHVCVCVKRYYLINFFKSSNRTTSNRYSLFEEKLPKISVTFKINLCAWRIRILVKENILLTVIDLRITTILSIVIHTASHIIWKTYSWVGRWFKKDFPFGYWNPRPMCCHRLLVNRDSFCSEKVFTSICIPRIIQTRLRYTKTVERNCQAFVILLCLSLSRSLSFFILGRERKGDL